jgi:cytochrome c
MQMKIKMLVPGLAGLLLLAGSMAQAAVDEAGAKELMKKGGCGACHAVGTKVVGPAFKDVAAKHKGQADAAATLVNAVRKGSKGVYGPIPMPVTPPARISDAELNDLAEWILTK